MPLLCRLCLGDLIILTDKVCQFHLSHYETSVKLRVDKGHICPLHRFAMDVISKEVICQLKL